MDRLSWHAPVGTHIPHRTANRRMSTGRAAVVMSRVPALTRLNCSKPHLFRIFILTLQSTPASTVLELESEIQTLGGLADALSLRGPEAAVSSPFLCPTLLY